MARRKKKPERTIAKPVPKWVPNPVLSPIAEMSIVSIPANAHAVIGQDFETDDQVDAVNYLAALLSLTTEQARAYSRGAKRIANPIPHLMTPDRMGDATGYCDSRRVLVYGYPYKLGLQTEWVMKAMPSLAVVGTSPNGHFRVESVPHILGATFKLDVPVTFVGPRMRYSFSPSLNNYVRRQPRPLVRWSAGGDFAFGDECEGWDTVIARATFDGTAVQISKWRGVPRVWVGFMATEPGEESATIYSGLAGFEGAAVGMFDQVIRGQLPSRVFVEWLCETTAIPFCMVDYATRCGFTCERN